MELPESLICKATCEFLVEDILKRFSSVFFFLNHESLFSETVFTGLTLKGTYLGNALLGTVELDQENCYFLKWLSSGASDIGV